MNKETILSRNVRLALNKTGRCRMLDNEVGMDQLTATRYGLGVGSPDLVGVLRNGKCFCLEVKTDRGTATKEQLAWLQAARKWNCFACIVRSIPEALAALERAEAGELS